MMTDRRILLRDDRSGHRAGGFTLVELLVAIMILSLLMTASFGAVRIAGRSWEAGVSHADATEELRAVSDFLRRRFAQLTPSVWLDGNDERIAFEGTARRMTFIAPAPEYSAGPGLLIYAITTERDKGKERLLLSYAAFDPGTGDFTEPYPGRHTILARNLTEVSFEYYGADSTATDPSWQQSWPAEAESFPLLIRIRTATTETDTGWPDLVFTLRSVGNP